jgi:hypothetical protein
MTPEARARFVAVWGVGRDHVRVTGSKAVVVGAAAAAAAGVLVAAGASAGGTAACPKPRYRNLVLVSARTGRVNRSFPDASAPPLAMVADGRGGWFLAMPDYCVGNVFVNGIAHLRPDGRLDRSWHARLPRTPLNGAVGELARVGNTLYAASGSWVEALNARTGARRWRVITNPKGGWSQGLAANWNAVFVGGYGGTRFEGKRHWGPVALDAKTGKVLPWHAALGKKLYAVGPLALDRGRLFIAVNTARAAIVAVDARTGHLTGWRAPQIKEAAGPFLVTHGLLITTNPDGNSYIANAKTGRPVSGFGHQGLTGFSTIAASDNTLYAWPAVQGCARSWTIQGQTRSAVAAINLRTLKLTPWTPATKTRYVCVKGIAADPHHVLLAGPLTAPNPANG